MNPELEIEISDAQTSLKVGERVVSFPLGALNVCDMYIESDPPKPEELSAALSVAELYVDELVAELQIPAVASIKGSGCVAEIAAVELGDGSVAANMGGHAMTSEAIEELFRWIATESNASRATNPGVTAGGESRLLGATLILVETLRQLNYPNIVVGLGDELS